VVEPAGLFAHAQQMSRQGGEGSGAPDGSGAIHPPNTGDVQALVFDISNVVGRENTWLVCFEDLDSGPMPKGCCVGTDNDFNDFVFEVHALGATPTVPLSFGALKMLYR